MAGIGRFLDLLLVGDGESDRLERCAFLGRLADLDWRPGRLRPLEGRGFDPFLEFPDDFPRGFEHWGLGGGGVDFRLVILGGERADATRGCSPRATFSHILGWAEYTPPQFFGPPPYSWIVSRFARELWSVYS